MKTSKFPLLLVVAWCASLALAFLAGKYLGAGKAGTTEGGPGAIVMNTPNGVGPAAGDESIGNSASTPASESNGDAESIDVPRLIATIRSQLGGGGGMMNPTAMMKAMGPMADLSESQVKEALQEVEATVSNQQQKVMFYSLLLARLAETDGAGAMAYIDEHLSGKGGMAMGVTYSVIGTWARREPDAAWEWFKSNRDDSEGGALGFGQVSAVFSGLAAQDIDSAFAKLEEIDDFERSQAISGIAMSSAWNPDMREELLAKAASLPEESRSQLYTTMIGQWAMSDPEEAIEWIESLPEDQQGPLKRQAGTVLMMTDPERGAEMALSGAREEELPGIYSSVISQWSMRDPNAAGEWLNSQPDGSHLDPARSAFSRNVVARDPVSAMEWAKTVQDENQRVNAVRHVYTQWKMKDAGAADSALDSSGLSAEKIQEFKAMQITPASRVPGGAVRFVQ